MWHIWTHPDFQRDKPDRIKFMVRRKSSATSSTTVTTPTTASHHHHCHHLPSLSTSPTNVSLAFPFSRSPSIRLLVVSIYCG